jgi:saccharopine dehydrogenase (NAD+, L-lysine-forming)
VKKLFGIRREDKNIWERRVPLIPEHLRVILKAGDLHALVQPYARRTFPDVAFQWVGATIQEDLGPCDTVFAVKEIPINFFQQGRCYAFFSHVIKGQSYNMPMLRALLGLGCTLIDYEKITDDQGRRLVFFSRQAGQAGLLDGLHILGQRLLWEGIPTPFADMKMAHAYSDLKAAQLAIRQLGRQITAGEIPAHLSPVVVGFTGYGNVSAGAQDVFDGLPFVQVEPEALLRGKLPADHRQVVKVVFREEHLVRRQSPGAFDLQHYYAHPEEYEAQFAQYLPHLDLLLNGIYWDERYPRLYTKADAARLWAPGTTSRLRVVSDVSCDLGGSIEFTARATLPDDPAYTYLPASDSVEASRDTDRWWCRWTTCRPSCPGSPRCSSPRACGTSCRPSCAPTGASPSRSTAWPRRSTGP